MKINIKKNIAEIDPKLYQQQKKRLFHSITMHLLILAFFIPFFLLTKSYHDSALKSSNKLDYISKNLSKDILHYVTINNRIDKAVNDINEIRIAGDKVSCSLLVHYLKTGISNLSYYYGIKEEIKAKISNTSSTNANVSSTKIELLLSASDDEKIIQFLDSLLLNLQGFIFIDKIEIIKKDIGTGVSSNIKLYWYTAGKIQDSLKTAKVLHITPKSTYGPIEEKYRITIWNGSLVS